MDWSIIGQKIKQQRKKQKITQLELANLIGKTESSIRKYEKGLVNIPTDVLELIAENLNITPLALIGPEWWNIQAGPEKLAELRDAYARYKAINKYLEEMGFTVSERVTKWHDEEVDDLGHTVKISDELEIILSKDGHAATFTDAEFEELQVGAKEAIEGRFYKKVLEQQKK